MGLKAGWIALFVFVWVIGAFLGSTFDYQSSDAAEGVDYTTGTATFTNGSTTVTGAGTAWVDATMAGGNIKCDADGVWYKIESVTNATELELYAHYANTGGAGMAYTMRPTPGWAGSGGGGYATSPLVKLQNLMQVNKSEQRNAVTGGIAILTSGTFWESAFEIVTWQWSFLYNEDGSIMMVYWILIFPFVVMGVLSMLLLVYGILTGNITWG